MAKRKFKLLRKQKPRRHPELNIDALIGEAQTIYEEAVKNKLMESDMRGGDINECWQLLKEAMQNSAETIVGQSQQTKQKSWISDETFQLVERKRQAKCKGNKTEYSKAATEKR